MQVMWKIMQSKWYMVLVLGVVLAAATIAISSGNPDTVPAYDKSISCQAATGKYCQDTGTCASSDDLTLAKKCPFQDTKPCGPVLCCPTSLKCCEDNRGYYCC